MTNIDEYLFGPLSKNWCLYFYILSILSFISFIFAFIYSLFYIFKKNADKRISLGLFIYSFAFFVMYVERRILHGMCIHSSTNLPQ